MQICQIHNLSTGGYELQLEIINYAKQTRLKERHFNRFESRDT